MPLQLIGISIFFAFVSKEKFQWLLQKDIMTDEVATISGTATVAKQCN